jgi:hypothetical protein
MFVCLFVCLYLIQIHISEPIGTKLCTHLPRGLEETLGHVWVHNISPFPNFSAYFFGSVYPFAHSRGLPATHCPATALHVYP